MLRPFFSLISIVAFATLFEFIVGPLVGDFYARLLLDLAINILLGVSLTLVNGFTGQFSIGHAGFMAVGGYAAGIFTYYGGHYFFNSIEPLAGFGHLWFLFSCCFGGVIAALLGFAVGLPSLRLKGDYLAIVTLGFAEILRVLLQQTDFVLSPKQIDETSALQSIFHLGGALGFSPLPTYTNLFWAYLWVGILILFTYRWKRSISGLMFLSIRENEIAAESLGINTTKIKVVAFVVAAFFAGISGSLFFHMLGITPSPDTFGFQRSFEIIIIVVLGGTGSITGTVLAALFITLIPELFREFADYRMIAYSLSLIAMMVWRPQGLLGMKEIDDFLPFRRKQ